MPRESTSHWRSTKRQWISITLGEFSRGGGVGVGEENNLRRRDCISQTWDIIIIIIIIMPLNVGGM